MVNLELIFKEQEKYVEKIIEDIRKTISLGKYYSISIIIMLKSR